MENFTLDTWQILGRIFSLFSICSPNRSQNGPVSLKCPFGRNLSEIKDTGSTCTLSWICSKGQAMMQKPKKGVVCQAGKDGGCRCEWRGGRELLRCTTQLMQPATLAQPMSKALLLQPYIIHHLLAPTGALIVIVCYCICIWPLFETLSISANIHSFSFFKFECRLMLLLLPLLPFFVSFCRSVSLEFLWSFLN